MIFLFVRACYAADYSSNHHRENLMNQHGYTYNVIIVLRNSHIISYLLYMRIPLTVVKVAIERQEFIVQ